MKKIYLFFIAAFLPLVFANSGYAQEIQGCCINPNADTSFICSDFFVTASQCCAGSPNECLNNTALFRPNVPCGTVAQCQTQGCCCSNRPAGITAQAQCPSQGFIPAADLGISCTSLCNIPQCEDALDNDQDGCIDSRDPDCQASNAESSNNAGSCINLGALNCNHRSYTPKITAFTAKQVKGEKAVRLEWDAECTGNQSRNPFYHEVYRCEGQNCNNFEAIGATTSPYFVDRDSALKFSASYTYKIASHYSIQPSQPSRTAVAGIGNLECMNRFDNDNFCIHESYYGQYKGYLVQNVNGFSSGNFLQNVKKVFSGRLNKAYNCDDNSGLNEVLACSGNSVCVASSQGPACMQQGACSIESANPFGLYALQQSCENNNYCFYDRSISIVDSCFACSPQMSCYDYKSKGTCERNSCNTGNCEWRPLSQNNELGVGVCVDTEANNCQWCSSAGTEGLESTEAWSSVFEQCSPQKAQLLSTGKYKCNFNGQIGESCQEVDCRDYLPQNNCQDVCGLGVCGKFGSECRKDGNNDNAPDCNAGDIKCEQDVYAPNTTIIPVIDSGKYKSLAIEIFDKTSSNDTYRRKTAVGYTTYICNQNIPGSCNSPAKTQSYSLVVFDLELYDRGAKILGLAEGENVLRYYSEDPSKNLGQAKTITVLASPNSTGPVVGQLSVEGANKIDGIYYTNILRPAITITFLKDSQLIVAKLAPDKNPNNPFLLNSSQGYSKTFVLTPPKNLDLGRYSLEIDAKDSNGLFMDSAFSAPVVIDNKKPNLVSIQPENGILIKNNPRIQFTAAFDEKVILGNFSISGQDIAGSFSSQDRIVHKANSTLEDGNKEILIKASDLAGNSNEFSSAFILNARPLSISMIEPPFGVSPNYTFNLAIGTDNNALCRYSLDLDLSFDNMESFPLAQGTRHVKANFDGIPDGSRSVHKLFVACDDPEQGRKTQIFDLVVDTEKPRIISGFADPGKIAETPRTTTLKIQTDKGTICKYSSNPRAFENMEGKFQGFDENAFGISHLQNITVDKDGSFRYYAACQAKSGLVSERKEINFISDITLPLALISHTPSHFNTTAVALSVETNKDAQCFYGANPKNINQPLSGVGKGHTRELQLDAGKYAYYVKCVSKSEASAPLEVGFIIDTTPPYMVYVDDTNALPSDPEKTWRTDKLPAKWLGKDNETGVSHYVYTLEEFAAAKTILNWTEARKEDEWVLLPENRDLNLSSGSRYLFTFRAINLVGIISEALSSNGIMVDPSSKPTSCTNSIRDLLETDIDCGGSCNSCAIGKACTQNIDCGSGFCNENKVCAAPTCSDKAKNQDESDADCGGNSCNLCINGKICVKDQDCASNSCSFGVCRDKDSCEDGILSGTESDIDCGGACPAKCQLGKSCSSDNDCNLGLACAIGKCSEREAGEKDTDKDGIPDRWEIDNGLDPNDESDAGSDSDKDGLSNLQEYKFGTNPNSTDTDGDGASDKKEIDKKTDPLDPSSRPKGVLGTLLLSLMVLLLLGGAGYGAYYYYQNYAGRKMASQEPLITHMPPPVREKPAQKPAAKKPKPETLFKKKEEQQREERGRLFEVFGGKKEQKQETKPSVSKPKEMPAEKAQPKPEKEDIFSRLKLISKAEVEKAGKSQSNGKQTAKKPKEMPKKRKPGRSSGKR